MRRPAVAHAPLARAPPIPRCSSWYQRHSLGPLGLRHRKGGVGKVSPRHMKRKQGSWEGGECGGGVRASSSCGWGGWGRGESKWRRACARERGEQLRGCTRTWVGGCVCGGGGGACAGGTPRGGAYTRRRGGGWTAPAALPPPECASLSLVVAGGGDGIGGSKGGIPDWLARGGGGGALVRGGGKGGGGGVGNTSGEAPPARAATHPTPTHPPHPAHPRPPTHPPTGVEPAGAVGALVRVAAEEIALGLHGGKVGEREGAGGGANSRGLPPRPLIGRASKHRH